MFEFGSLLLEFCVSGCFLTSVFMVREDAYVDGESSDGVGREAEDDGGCILYCV